MPASSIRRRFNGLDRELQRVFQSVQALHQQTLDVNLGLAQRPTTDELNQRLRSTIISFESQVISVNRSAGDIDTNLNRVAEHFNRQFERLERTNQDLGQANRTQERRIDRPPRTMEYLYVAATSSKQLAIHAGKYCSVRCKEKYF